MIGCFAKTELRFAALCFSPKNYFSSIGCRQNIKE